MTQAATKIVQPIKNAFAKAMADAGSDPEALASILEAMLTASSICAAVMGRGSPETMNKLLEGGSAYLFESAAYYQKFGAAMALK